MLSLTPLGFLFIPLAVGLALLARGRLPLLLVVSASLHAPAVATIAAGNGNIGITPWLTAAGAILLALCWEYRASLDALRQLDATSRRLLLGWLAFAFWGCVSAVVLPIAFAGVLTYNPEHVMSLATPPEPLQLRTINLVQAFNLAVIAALLVATAIAARRDAVYVSRILQAIVVTAVVALLLSIWQRLITLGVLGSPLWIEESLNPSYLQTVGYGLGEWLRLNWPFSEPSYAGVWFAGVYASGLAVWLFSTRPRIGLVLVGCGALGVANSMGGSGVASAIATSGVASVLAIGLRIIVRNPQSIRAMRRWLALLALGLLLVGVAYMSPKPDALSSLTPQYAFEQIIVSRWNDYRYPLNGLSRTSSNLHALQVLQDTYGIGVGLSGNRASSYVLNLLSNLGVVASLGFAALLIVQAARLFPAARSGNATAIAVLGGQFGLFLGIAAGIPDLNWPGWWIWVLVSFGAGVALAPAPPGPEAFRGIRRREAPSAECLNPS